MSENLSSFVNKSYQGEHPGQEGGNDSDENTPTQVGSIKTEEMFKDFYSFQKPLGDFIHV